MKKNDLIFWIWIIAYVFIVHVIGVTMKLNIWIFGGISILMLIILYALLKLEQQVSKK